MINRSHWFLFQFCSLWNNAFELPHVKSDILTITCEIEYYQALTKHSHACIILLIVSSKFKHKLLPGEPIRGAGWIVPGDLASQSSDFQINFTPAAASITTSHLSLHSNPLAPPISANHVSDNRYTRHLNHSSYTLNNTPTPPTYTVANRKHG